MTITTTTAIAGPVNRIHQAGLLAVAKANCPYFIGSQAATIVSHGGSFTAHWRRFDELTPTTTAKSEITGTLSLPTREGTPLAVTDVTATIARYGDHAFLTEDMDLVNPTSHSMGIMETFGVQAGRSLNRLQRNELEDNLTIIYQGGGSADTDVADPIGKAAIENVETILATNSAMEFTAMTTGSTNIGTNPILPAYWGICHSHMRPDIEKLSGFKGVETYAGQAVPELGEFGKLGRTRWLETPEASIDTDSGAAAGGNVRSTGSATADLYRSVIIGQNCHGSVGLDTEHIKETYKAGDQLPGVMVIQHAKGTSGVADPLDEISSTGWKSWHAPKILNGNWGRTITSAASTLI